MDKSELLLVFKTAAKAWLLHDNAVIRAAALTFFIVLPLPTLLLIVIAIFEGFIGQEQAIQILMQQISALTGPAIAELFSELIVSTGSPFNSLWSTIFVISFSVIGGIGAFSVLRDTLDSIWGVRLPRGRPLLRRLGEKIVPFALVSSLGLIVITWSAIAGTLFNAIGSSSTNAFLTFIALAIAQVFFSFAIATLLLAIIYKLIPQARIHWRDVTLAAIVTGVAFTATNYLFGIYMQTFAVTTIVGAAGTLLYILLWIFTINQIVLFGAEVSKAFAITVGTLSEKNSSKKSILS